MEIYVSTKIFTGRITVKEDVIVATPPICKWVMGNSAKWFRQYLERKNQLLEWIEIKPERR